MNWLRDLWGQVYPNLLASAITGSLAWLWARRKIRHLHGRLDDLHDTIRRNGPGREYMEDC